MKKITKLQFAGLLPFAFLVGLCILLFALSPIWPEYEIWRSGLIILALLTGTGLSMLYVSWVERIKEKENNSKEDEE